ncbi:MAG: hypothetical protein HS119_09925 [Flavobacteriales bacterium]|nr:hypothetical protein [Flavobacteriales bacterium]MCL4856383.1 hypothetical protein [Flavobacteriales bacterium]
MGDIDKSEERIYKMLEDYKVNCEQNKFYSMQRVDLIVISISSGSIAGLLSKIELICNNTCWAISSIYFITIVSFLASIIFNIFSQLSSHEAHNIERRWAMNEMEKINEPQNNNEISTEILLSSENQSKKTVEFNNYSLFTLYLGFFLSLVLIALFIF